MANMPSTLPPLVHVKVTLKETKPPVWRRFRLPTSWHLGQLSDAILGGMGWNGEHLHEFEVEGRKYSDPKIIQYAADERQLTIGKLITSGVSRFNYTYDFGDYWEHSVLIEAKAVSPGETEPGCVAGAWACPPENCGGPPGYASLVEALEALDEPESQKIIELYDEEFDPDAFDLNAADQSVKEV